MGIIIVILFVNKIINYGDWIEAFRKQVRSSIKRKIKGVLKM